MIRSFQWDLARQVERLDWLLAQLPRYADWGYHEVHLHLEDAVEYPSLPGVARPDAYTYRQFERLVAAATRAGIKVVPIVNLLGHTQYLIKVPALRDLNELRAADGTPLDRGQICPVHPRALEVAGKLLRDVLPFCTAGKVHVGLDESFSLGRHPLSRREVERIGLAGHFAAYVGRLRELTRSLGLQMGMWADMLYFLPDAIALLPADLSVYEWYYHAFRRWPRVELFNFAEVDLTTPLRARGIQRYGCPMNGAFRYEPLPHFTDRMNNLRSWWRHAKHTGAAGFLVSAWEPNRLGIELTTAIDAAAAALWLEPEITEPREMLSRGFHRAFNGSRGTRIPRAQARRLADLALACDRYPFAGYPRWEINERWDTLSPRELIVPYAEEQRHFSGLLRQAHRLRAPVPLEASVELRHALAVRDVAVRRLCRLGAQGSGPLAGRTVTRELRAALRTGIKAARILWDRTRDPAVASPNEQMFRRDLDRLAAVGRGERVFGPGWWLTYIVRNFAPAVQLVGVEQRGPDGSWRTLQSCHTIEFQTRTARPRATLERLHAAPVEWKGDLERAPVLRLFVRGTGEVQVGGLSLTNGRTDWSFRFASRGKWIRLGRPAPQAGWPVADNVAAGSVLPLELAAPSRRSRPASASARPAKPAARLRTAGPRKEHRSGSD